MNFMASNRALGAFLQKTFLAHGHPLSRLRIDTTNLQFPQHPDGILQLIFFQVSVRFEKMLPTIWPLIPAWGYICLIIFLVASRTSRSREFRVPNVHRTRKFHISRTWQSTESMPSKSIMQVRKALVLRMLCSIVTQTAAVTVASKPGPSESTTGDRTAGPRIVLIARGKSHKNSTSNTRNKTNLMLYASRGNLRPSCGRRSRQGNFRRIYGDVCVAFNQGLKGICCFSRVKVWLRACAGTSTRPKLRYRHARNHSILHRHRGTCNCSQEITDHQKSEVNICCFDVSESVVE